QKIHIIAITFFFHFCFGNKSQGCAVDAGYRRMAHELVDPWQVDPSPKKSKLSLIRRLGDYARWLGHESVDS
ncbi:hypothetical protein NE573_23550, partial [Parabacteroides distasonis]|nr:hypothetical protein [Parabacteroides distasonis]